MNLAGLRILVTGGAGFIGSHLVDHLVSRCHIRVVDDFSSGSERNLAHHAASGRLEVIKGSVCDASLLDSVIRDVDVVFHLAVQGVRVSIGNPGLVHEVNATGTLNVCEAARTHRVRRLIYVSSSEVYGTAAYTPMDEAHPLEPTTPYGASKLAGELYAKAFYRTYGLPVVIVRPFNTYGPRAHVEGFYGEVIPKFVIRALHNIPPVIFGDGDQTRDFTYVTDTVRGICAAAESEALIGLPVNVARGREISVNDLARIILRSLDRGHLRPKQAPPRPGDVRRHWADVSFAKTHLDFSPEVDFETGIARYIEWVQSGAVDLDRAMAEEVERNWREDGR